MVNPINKAKFVKVIASCAVALLSCSVAMAQQKRTNLADVKLVTKALTAAELPEAGNAMQLKVELLNARDIDLPVRLTAIKDRKLVIIPVARAYRNSEDHPTYEFDLTAPLIELRYQFSLPVSTKQAISTQMIEVRRNCVPDITLVDPKAEQPSTVAGKLKLLSTQAQSLESELDQYGSALTQLNAVKQLVQGEES